MIFNVNTGGDLSDGSGPRIPLVRLVTPSPDVDNGATNGLVGLEIKGAGHLRGAAHTGEIVVFGKLIPDLITNPPDKSEEDVLSALAAADPDGTKGLSGDRGVDAGMAFVGKWHDDPRDHNTRYDREHIYPMLCEYLKFCERFEIEVDRDLVLAFLFHDSPEKIFELLGSSDVEQQEKGVLMKAEFEQVLSSQENSIGERVLRLVDYATKKPKSAFEGTPEEVKLERVRQYMERIANSGDDLIALVILKTMDKKNNIGSSNYLANHHKTGFSKLADQLAEAKEYFLPLVNRYFEKSLAKWFTREMSTGYSLLAKAQELELYTPEVQAD